jgi:predicted PhzF superfamily epimerase YddE/YHI9
VSQLKYHHVDVFAPGPFSGNSLTVFLDAGSLHRSQMQRITQEMRHFESIFLSPAGAPNTSDAHVFDLIEEAMTMAMRLAEQLRRGTTVATVVCDTGMKYLKTYGTKLSRRDTAVPEHRVEAGK